jgi:hypothetical protein
VHGITAGSPRPGDQPRDVEVGRRIGSLHRRAGHAQIGGGLRHAERDLAAVGDEDVLEHAAHSGRGHHARRVAGAT